MPLSLKISKLSKSFGSHHVLKNINVNVPKQAVYGFLGNNGAGKSTLVRLLMGLLKADSGNIEINGVLISPQQIDYKKDIGALIDSPCLYLHLTPKEYLGMSCLFKSLPKVCVEKALEDVDMQAHGNVKMANFSLGMKQRIGLANALLGDPKLLILDEPTNGLDPMGMQEIRKLLKQLPLRTGTTVFLSSHLLDEIQKTATHIGILHQGEIKIESPLDVLLQQQSDSLDIVTDRPLELINYFKQQNTQVELTSEKQVRLLGVEQSQCATINQNIINSGFSLIESRFNQASLEKFFLNLIKGEENVD